MFKRLFFLMVIPGAMGLPYLMSSSSSWLSTSSPTSMNIGDAKTPVTASFAASSPTKAKSTGEAPAKPIAIEGFGAADLGEVFQFDGTPAWVMARWPRVTAGLAELDLQGYRVPLVSGTSQGDLAGSLTYYFDKNQRISFITFHGTTGDPRKLVALVASRYRLVPQTTDDPSLSLYQMKWNGKPVSELRIRTARVVRADQPFSRYEIDVALKRP
ncbi:MAG TPA: DUF6690 family protein [Pirellulales bacterium]|nr:DUF6690 family protein [Pirellulales bacterium]